MAPTRKFGMMGRYVQHFVSVWNTGSDFGRDGAGSMTQAPHVASLSSGSGVPSTASSQSAYSGGSPTPPVYQHAMRGCEIGGGKQLPHSQVKPSEQRFAKVPHPPIIEPPATPARRSSSIFLRVSDLSVSLRPVNFFIGASYDSDGAMPPFLRLCHHLDVRILGIHHAQITVPIGALDAALVFYTEVLQLPRIEKPANLRARGGFWLQVGAQQVHVNEEDGIPREKSRAHVAYEVTDLEAWRARLGDAGVVVLGGEPIPGYLRVELRDPFGNRIELIERTEPVRH
jgi:catechol 2,3-dioxygenase-like lactoylglutathione lyase family enzyme